MPDLISALLSYRPDLIPSSLLDAAAADLLGRAVAANRLPVPGPADAWLLGRIAAHGLAVDAASQVALSEVGAPDVIARRILSRASTRRIVANRSLTHVGSATRPGPRGGTLWAIVLARPKVVPPPPPPPTPDPAPTTEPVQAELLRLHNDRRRPTGAPPLTLDDRLQRAALIQARDQARRHRLGHDGSDGSNVAVRVGRQGYSWRALGENAAEGQVDVPQVMRDWVGSPGHRRNIEDPAYTQFGGAMAAADDGTRYWTTVFAAPATTRGHAGGEVRTPDWDTT